MRSTLGVSKIAAFALVFSLLALPLLYQIREGHVDPVAFAAEALMEDPSAGQAEDTVETAVGLIPTEPEMLRLSLSEPVLVSKAGGREQYTTTLTIEGISALYGYQIQVAAVSEDDMTLNNLVEGTVTEPVYMDGSAFLAVLLGERQTGDIAICEILSSYPANGTAPGNQERNIVVTKLEAVTSIASETMLVLGPDPVAASVAIPVRGLFTALPPWAFALILGLLFVAATAVVLLVRRHRQREGWRVEQELSSALSGASTVEASHSDQKSPHAPYVYKHLRI